VGRVLLLLNFFNVFLVLFFRNFKLIITGFTRHAIIFFNKGTKKDNSIIIPPKGIIINHPIIGIQKPKLRSISPIKKAYNHLI